MSYKSIADLRAIVSGGIPEGVTLEYKASSVLLDRDISAICKTVTAFANSVGGHFIIGIESKAGAPFQLDGGLPAPSKRDWIHKIINANTFPAVETIEIEEFSDVGGIYYVIGTPASPHAPHQSNDRRYYRRRGSHSEPMEHYEIEDVRSRPKQHLAPLRMALFTQDQLAFLHFRNDSNSDSVKNFICRVDSNFEFERDGIDNLHGQGLREFRPQVERYFVLDAVPMMLSKNKAAELHIHVSYQFRDSTIQDSASFYLADLSNSTIIESATVKALNKLGEKVEKLSGHVERLKRDTEAIAQIADGSGLRLSQRTLRALKNVDQLFEPREFDWEGYKILLDISDDDALHLHQIFGTIDSGAGRKNRYEKLSSELRERFEKIFRVDFE